MGKDSSNIYHYQPAQWLAYVALFAVLAAIPGFGIDVFELNLYARYAVYAMLAVSVSMVWGFGGILSLGQGIPFGIAAYCMGATMQMQFQDPEFDPIPSFMLTNELEALPTVWEPFWNTSVGLILAIGLPTLFMAVFGILMFQARLAGAFVAIMTLAMLNAWYSVAYDMQPYTAGFNGISPPNPFKAFDTPVDPYSLMIYWIAIGVLAVVTLFSKYLMESKFGTVVQATRDDAERVRFLGYSVAYYQVVVFVFAGLIATLAGMIWVMTVQYVSPTLLETPFSIYMVIWAAVGGRHSLFGAIIAAIVLNGLQSYLGDISEIWQKAWLLVLGGIFVGVVLFLPRGLAGLIEKVLSYVPFRFGRRATRPERAAG
ncbi:MAG: urea ABC transporter permease subunit UrtC [Alphaproteobacteria bacterium]